MEPSPLARPARPTTAVALMAAGGVLVVVGAILPWFEVSSTVDSADIAGTDMSVGLGSLLFGALAAVFAVVAWLRGPATGGRGWSITVLVLTALVALVAAGASVAPESTLTELAAEDVSEQFGVSESVAEAALEQAFTTGVLSASAKSGSFVTLGGGILGVIGGIMGIVFAARRREAMAPAPPAAGPPPAAPQQPPPPPLPPD